MRLLAAITHGGGMGARARYRLRMLTAFAVYALLVVASVVVLNTSAADSAWWRTPVALLPMAPALYGVHAVVSWFREVDELDRLMLLEALGFAFGGTFVVTFSYGLLQAGAEFPELNWMWVLVVMGALWLVGDQLARWRYR